MPKKIDRDPAKSPKQRRLNTYEAFKSKVALLTEWGENGLPYQAYYPKDRTALRAWTGPDGTFGVWTDPTIDRIKNGKYPELTQAFIKAIDNIKNWSSRYKAKIEIALEENSRLEANNKALVMQNAELISRLDKVERQTRLWKAIADAKAAQ